MDTAVLSTKGQLVIPSHIRNALNLRAGDKVSIRVEGEAVLVQRAEPKRARLIEKNGRKLLKAAPGSPPMTPERIKALLADFP